MRFSSKMNSPVAFQPSHPLKPRQRTAAIIAQAVKRLSLLLCALPLASCLHLAPADDDDTPKIQGFAGIVVADEPAAALVGHRVLADGGSAADAAIATAFALSVTLPSQAGLGAGGVCMVYDRSKQKIDSLDFTPPLRATPVPALTRGLYLLYVKYGGQVAWQQLVAPATAMARQGQPVSRALARHLVNWPSGAISEATKATFFHADGRALGEGEPLLQPALGATLARIGAFEAAAFYSGSGAERVAASYAATVSDAPGASDLRAYVASWRDPAQVAVGRDKVYFPAGAPANSGEGLVWRLAIANQDQPGNNDAAERLKPILEFFRTLSPAAQTAATGFVVLAKDGSAVACDISLGRMFGAGRLADDLGFLPAAGDQPLLQPMVEIDTGSGDFRFALAAPPAMAGASQPQGLDAIACSAGASLEEGCRAGTDPKGAGLASE
jgi:gamma-glutamyltranspeptidase/glutathione hydrolase